MRFSLFSFIAAAGLLTSTTANAALVSITQKQDQTIAGENFMFSFNGLSPSDGSGGMLILHAQGDYDGRDDEILSWDAEGVIGAPAVGGFNDVVNGMPEQGGPFDFVNVFQPLGNVEFQRTYTLSAMDLNLLLADSIISILVDLDDNVGLFQPPNFVEFTLIYNSDMSEIPIPAAFPLFLAGLGALGVGARRRKSR